MFLYVSHVLIPLLSRHQARLAAAVSAQTMVKLTDSVDSPLPEVSVLGLGLEMLELSSTKTTQLPLSESETQTHITL